MLQVYTEEKKKNRWHGVGEKEWHYRRRASRQPAVEPAVTDVVSGKILRHRVSITGQLTGNNAAANVSDMVINGALFRDR